MVIGLLPYLALPANGHDQLFGQGVHHRNTDPVQTTGNLVTIVIELAAGVQYGHDYLGRRHPLLRVNVYRYATAVIFNTDRLVLVDSNPDLVTVPCKRFINGVIHHLEYHVVQTGAIVSITNIHARSFAYRIQPLQDLDITGIVSSFFTHSLAPQD